MWSTWISLTLSNKISFNFHDCHRRKWKLDSRLLLCGESKTRGFVMVSPDKFVSSFKKIRTTKCTPSMDSNLCIPLFNYGYKYQFSCFLCFIFYFFLYFVFKICKKLDVPYKKISIASKIIRKQIKSKKLF